MTAKHVKCPHCGWSVQLFPDRLTVNITRAQDDYLRDKNVAKTFQSAVVAFDGNLRKAERAITLERSAEERVPVQCAVYLGEAIGEKLHGYANALNVPARTVLRILLQMYIEQVTSFS